MSIEQRFFNEADYKADLGFEERGEKKQKVIHGYPAKYNKLSLNLGGYRENILPGFFARCLRNGDDVRALVNHDPSLMLGRTSAGTCRLEEDRTGLLMECEPGDTSVSRDVITWIQRKEMDQGSFRFRVREDNWRVQDGQPIRDLIDCEKLSDVSVVTFPAYEDTSALVRSVTQLAGVDFGRLAGILVRIEHKLEVTGEDRDFIAAAGESLLKAQRDLKPVLGSKGDGRFLRTHDGAQLEISDAMTTLETARRRLALASRELE